MSIQIDRAHNVIVNTNGVAHHTGYMFLERKTSCLPESIYDLVKGRGGYSQAKGMFTINQVGNTLFSCTRAELTLQKFVEVTGWSEE